MEMIDKVQEMVSSSLDEISSNIIECCLRKSESPIESVLATSFVLSSAIAAASGQVPLFIMADEDCVSCLEKVALSVPGTIAMSKQMSIGEYRADFCAIMAISLVFGIIVFRLIVECDGHDWHEKTKEQAAADKARDRFFSREGYGVLRFTGSEIWANPAKCADEVAEYFIEKRRFSKGIEDIVNYHIDNAKREWSSAPNNASGEQKR